MRDLENKFAIVTGASTGIGADFAELLAARGCGLLLVARTESKLRDLQQRLSQSTGMIQILALDVGLPGSPQRVFQEIERQNLKVDFLVNNAGFGSVGDFAEVPWETDEALINLNVRALHHLTKLFVKHMADRGGGHILNVASMVGFQPAPHFAAYAATKAYVLSLSVALNVELAGTNVRVSALCPGTTRTPFWQAAGSRGNRIREFSMMDSRKVADCGLRLMLSGNAIGIPGLMNNLMIFVSRFVPRVMAARVSGFFMKE
jgi:short-subunit dehydrogenase